MPPVAAPGPASVCLSFSGMM
jgi:hypothetical protein